MEAKQRIIILGGGTAGWMTAAALSRYLPKLRFSIQLIESAQIGTVGVGEATIPHIRQFNQWIGLDEADFLQATGASYKLAIRFRGWGQANSDYYHPFGLSGEDLYGLPFHQHWLWLQQQKTASLKNYGQYSLAVLMAQQGKFSRPVADLQHPASAFNYAYHLDAALYAALLRQHSIDHGVEWLDGKVTAVTQHNNGDIAHLILEDGRHIDGDLFIDCSGFSALLIDKTLQTGYDNWQHWLPCDKALAVPSEKDPTPPSYTSAKAMTAGWQWRIPLQHRTGNGLVYCSSYLNDSAAEQELMAGLEEQALAPARALQFVTGRRKQSWVKNCVAIGLSSGFLEPLESTSLYLVQIAIESLLQYFPSNPVGEVERELFNQKLELEYLRVRDLLILHYKLNARPEPFWQYCAQMAVPDSLSQRLEMFRETGHLLEYRQGLFQPASWLALYLGQGLQPQQLDARLSALDPTRLQHWFNDYQQQLQQLVQAMPEHHQVLRNTELAGAAVAPAFSLYGHRG
jgi:tryptophan halogenase